MHFTKQSVDIKLLAVFYINIKLLFCQGNFVNLFTRQGVKNIDKKKTALITKARKRLIDKSVTQAELAKKYGVSKPYVSLVLHGKRTLTPAFEDFLKRELDL